MTFGSIWRKHPFIEGHCYLARESFRGYPDSEFVAGVLYEFQHVGYSRYDSSTVRNSICATMGLLVQACGDAGS